MTTLCLSVSVPLLNLIPQQTLGGWESGDSPGQHPAVCCKGNTKTQSPFSLGRQFRPPTVTVMRLSLNHRPNTRTGSARYKRGGTLRAGIGPLADPWPWLVGSPL